MRPFVPKDDYQRGEELGCGGKSINYVFNFKLPRPGLVGSGQNHQRGAASAALFAISVLRANYFSVFPYVKVIIVSSSCPPPRRMEWRASRITAGAGGYLRSRKSDAKTTLASSCLRGFRGNHNNNDRSRHRHCKASPYRRGNTERQNEMEGGEIMWVTRKIVRLRQHRRAGCQKNEPTR